MRITGITYVHRKTHKIRNTIIILLILFIISFVAAILINNYTNYNVPYIEKLEFLDSFID